MVKPINIILVDDEPLCRYGFISLIKKTHIKVIAQASNGAELFQLLKTNKPEIIVLDLEMPVLNGSKALTKLRKDRPELKVVILSKYHDDELIKDMFNRGASAFLSKNSDLKIMIKAITKVATDGIFNGNINFLLDTPCFKDGHYYKMILTPREIEIMKSLYESKSFREIGEELKISEKTVKNHAKSIYKKMKVKTRNEFAVTVTKLGLNYIGS